MVLCGRDATHYYFCERARFRWNPSDPPGKIGEDIVEALRTGASITVRFKKANPLPASPRGEK